MDSELDIVDKEYNERVDESLVRRAYFSVAEDI